MLVEFAVRNFRSVRDEQRLSMVASSLSEHVDTHTFEANAPGVGRLLRTAVIYGANAAGKSNLLKALDVMQDIVLLSANESQSGEAIPVVPFMLDESATQPTMFEVVFVENNVRYQYGFEATRERVTAEWLFSFPERQPRKLFEREFVPGEDTYKWTFSPSLKGPKAAWRSATRTNALFLSTAIQLNSEQLAPVFSWFQNRLKTGMGVLASPQQTARVVQDSDGKQRISEFMRRADIDITDFRVVEEAPNEKVVAILRAVVPDAELERMIARPILQVSVEHRTKSGKSVWFALEDESEGTQRLFAFLGPIFDALENGRIFVIDELNNSLHPLIMRALIASFCDPKVNKSSAQFIFTTHATSILNAELFRRDQIWFAERNGSFGTKIFPLSDFKPRKHSSFAKAYLEGRYGAVPLISSELLHDG